MRLLAVCSHIGRPFMHKTCSTPTKPPWGPSGASLMLLPGSSGVEASVMPASAGRQLASQVLSSMRAQVSVIMHDLIKVGRVR